MKRLLTAALAVLLVASACGTDDEGQTTTTAPATTAATTDTTRAEEPTSATPGTTGATAGNGGPVLVTVGLRTFASCDAILSYYIENALELVGPYGLDGGPSIWRSDDAVAEEAMAAAEADAAAATTSSQSAPSFTGTNVQVAGVDEADVVKTDGFYIYSLLDDRSRLRIVEVKDGGMNLQSTLDVGFEPREMLL
ncbi:MAG: beta-propeller domain-containing protein, partial [bacterium]|nr:beta-propeller domain-containing protein [bacterium]